MRYAPFLILVVVVVIVAVALAGGNDRKKIVTPPPNAENVPVQYQQAQAAGALGQYTWQDHCDKTTGRVAVPMLDPAPCVPKFTGDNGGATSLGVTADTIRIGYYVAKPDPLYDFVLKQAGAYDPPDQIAATAIGYAQILASQYELYGRKIQMIRIDGSGPQTDGNAAKIDADKAAKQFKVFAVVGGPAQTPAFAQELAANHVLCIGTCIIAQPERFYSEHSPYMWPVGPSPEQSSAMLVEFLKKQLIGKDAIYAGDPAFRNKTRTFALLTYDTPDGQFKAAWDHFEQILKDAGVNIVLHKSYFLDVNALAQTGHDVGVALKRANATSVIFTGDPIIPKYFTDEADTQGYFPEWIMAGTVFADTSVFARTFDQKEWAHAFGLQLTPARVNKEQNNAYLLYKWWFGTAPPA
ncbi:MAG TPA: ABC transporter substrate-binding protein, partial [Acidimicrobiia bacterium]|nr:ABC transporter substrate-binding protein [Acidimicrobiia bacterium]